MGGEAVDRAGGLVAAGDPPVAPALATEPGTIGEVRRRRARGSHGRRREWFLRGKGERRGKLQKNEGNIAIASYNIRDGRNGGLLSVARALDHANVDVAVVQETKLKNPSFAPRTGFGYQIHTTAAGTGNCGGVSLLVREGGAFGIEEVKVWGENVLLFELQVGKEEKDR